MELTHLNEYNNPKMVDVSNKEETTRIAIASGEIKMSNEAYQAIILNTTKKGPVIQTAVIAAIQAAKKTHELIPMCHPLLISGIDCKIEEIKNTCSFKLIVTVNLKGQTGVEMEALTSVSIGLLTIYDMVKAIDKSMVISNIKLESKTGGINGDYKR